MKTLTLALLLIVSIASTAFAAPPAKYRFTAISSASNITCGIFGQTNLKRNTTESTLIQGFGADTVHSRILSLGTKGFGTYSTTGKSAFAFTCVATGTTTAVPVKMSMDDVETYYLTVDSGIYVIGR